MSDQSPPLEQNPWPALAWSGFIAGPLLAVLAYILLPPELGHQARAVGAVAALMATWWLTDAAPIEATALLPLVLFPLSGVMSLEKAAVPYAGEQVFLFMGGFILGLSMEKWGLHKRIALVTMSIVGTGPARLVGGLMLATALISLWVNNTATAIVMLPIGMSIVHLVHSTRAGDRQRPDDPFALCVVLGIAYAASIGGVGTLVGTTPNILMSKFLTDNGARMDFASWLWVGVPCALLLLPLSWVLLTRVIFPLRGTVVVGARELIRRDLAALGPISRAEWITIAVFGAAVIWWVFRQPLQNALGISSTTADGRVTYPISDAVIAMAAAVALFLIPANIRTRTFMMDWRTAVKLPWGVLLLFGGGLSLANAMSATRLDAHVGTLFEGLRGVPPVVMTLVIVAAVVFLSELASNTALTATMLPVMKGAEDRLGLPTGTLIVPMTMAASCGFMLPVATPPNALAFATGCAPMRQMIKAGFWLDIAGIAVIVAVTSVFGGRATAG